MVYISNMDRSIEFYRDKLGLPLRYRTDEWTEFETGHTTLALHVGEKTQQSMGRKTMSPVPGYCDIGFNVDNIDEAYRVLKERGVAFVMEPKAREGEGIKLAICLDPDGLPISIAETQRPPTITEVSAKA